MDQTKLLEYLKLYGQEHLLQFYDKLSSSEKEILYKDITSFDFGHVTRLFQEVTGLSKSETNGSIDDDLLEPLPSENIESLVKLPKERIEEYRQIGLKAVSEGSVAVLLMAGGQGTRLGVDYPKGMYKVGLPSNKSLFQLQAERLRRLEKLAFEATGKSANIPWYIMTSERTKEATEEFFVAHNYFGLRKENVVIFEQNVLPCLTFDGKIIMEKPYKLATSPDGNGGLYAALKDCQILTNMEKRDIKYVHVYGVDNILVKMADPSFIGYCISKNAEAGGKVVEKVVPNEAVGIICKVKGKYQVVEYSEVSPAIAGKRDPDGRLTYRCGSICNHFFTVNFLKVIVDKSLKHHIAKKKIPFVDPAGNLVKPDTPNGIKLEKFVFDVFQYASKFVAWEVLPEEEFAPLKNADGSAKDNPTTCRQALSQQHQRFILNAGGCLAYESALKSKTSNGELNGCNGKSASEEMQKNFVCEISPLLSYEGEGLEKIVAGKTFTSPTILYSEEEEEAANGAKPITHQVNGTCNSVNQVTCNGVKCA